MRKPFAATATALLLVTFLAGSAHGAPNDPFFQRQWGLTKIRADEAWPIANGAGAMIAIVDSGVDLDHPDLGSKIVSYSDADFTGDSDPNGAQDGNGHGTHVAGIAAAITGNGVGVAGTAPAASILPVRVLDEDGSGTTMAVANGIRYAADKGADVVNLSLGAKSGIGHAAQLLGDLDDVYEAIEYAWGSGAVVVVAAGNDSVPLCAEPANAPHAMCVGATDARDLRSHYSNSDATMTRPFLVAPGGGGATCAGDIFSTYLRVATPSTCSPSAGYETSSGTSMATPFVSGVAPPCSRARASPTRR